MIVAYVSGHGYGHATRVAEVLRAVRVRDGKLPITVVTAAPEMLFRRGIPGKVAVRPLVCDVGLAQRDALTIDEAETARLWRAFHADNGDRVDAEWRWIHHSGAKVVLGDVPPLAFEAAGELGLPSVALANFSWDWIYRHMAQRQAALGEAATWAAAAYRQASLLLRLPFAGDLSVFPRIVDIPLVARRPSVSRREARKRLSIGGGPVALVSFGGVGLEGMNLGALGSLPAIQFLVVGEQAMPAPNVRYVAAAELERSGLRYEDVVGASDVVVTKPGYGIVTDAIGAGARIVYTDRGDFPEYPVLVAEMSRYVPTAHVDKADLLAGRIGAALEAVLSQEVPPPPDLSGASAAAEHLLALM
jgi:hypothetical protein